MRLSLFRQLEFLGSSSPSVWRALSSASSTRLNLKPSSKPESQQQQQQQQEQQHPSPPATTAPPLIYPSAPSPHHTDLPTFLAYSRRTNLDPSSTVYVGTHFEYTAAAALVRYGLSLRRVGGASDCGIDLLGIWSLSLPHPAPKELRVIAQCKAVRRPGPHLVRELEGAFAGAPAGWRPTTTTTRSGVVGLLVTERPATKGIREALARSRWPMGYVACSREGSVGQFLWNQRAEEEGLEGLGVGLRHGGGQEKEVVLTWRGKTLSFEGSVQGEG
ncbi:hypothetical protein P885DRAFT_28695 [Corynascus similis CBS 632.67]